MFTIEAERVLYRCFASAVGVCRKSVDAHDVLRELLAEPAVVSELASRAVDIAKLTTELHDLLSRQSEGADTKAGAPHPTLAFQQLVQDAVKASTERANGSIGPLELLTAVMNIRNSPLERYIHYTS